MTDEPLKSQEEVEAWFEKVRAAFPRRDRPHHQRQPIQSKETPPDGRLSQ